MTLSSDLGLPPTARVRVSVHIPGSDNTTEPELLLTPEVSSFYPRRRAAQGQLAGLDTHAAPSARVLSREYASGYASGSTACCYPWATPPLDARRALPWHPAHELALRFKATDEQRLHDRARYNGRFNLLRPAKEAGLWYGGLCSRPNEAKRWHEYRIKRDRDYVHRWCWWRAEEYKAQVRAIFGR